MENALKNAKHDFEERNVKPNTPILASKSVHIYGIEELGHHGVNFL